MQRGVLTRKRTIKRKTTGEAVPYEVGGNRFREEMIQRVIRNPIYKGVVRFKGKEYPGQHEALVSVEVWEAANAAIASVMVARSKGNVIDLKRDKHFNLLKGLLICGSCKGSFTPHASGKLDSHGRPYRYYTCSRVAHNHDLAQCAVRQISAEGVEGAVVGLLGQMAHHPLLIEAVLIVGKTNAVGTKDVLEKQIRKIGAEIDKLTAGIKNLINALAENGATAMREEIEIKFTKIKQRKDLLVAERIRARQELAAIAHDVIAPSQVCTALEKFATLWPMFAGEEKRELVSLSIASVEVHEAKA